MSHQRLYCCQLCAILYKPCGEAMSKAMRIRGARCSVLAQSEVDVVACLAVREIEKDAVSGLGVVVKIVPYCLAIIDLSLGAALAFDRYSLALPVYVGKPQIKNLADAQSASPHEDYHCFCLATDREVFDCSVVVYIVNYSWHSTEKFRSLDVADIVVYDNALMF